MDFTEFDRKISLVKLLAYNIVQIRALCETVYKESKTRNNLEALQRVTLYVEASFNKTYKDERNMQEILTSLRLEAEGFDAPRKEEYFAILALLEDDVKRQLSDSVFNYKEE